MLRCLIAGVLEESELTASTTRVGGPDVQTVGTLNVMSEVFKNGAVCKTTTTETTNDIRTTTVCEEDLTTLENTTTATGTMTDTMLRTTARTTGGNTTNTTTTETTMGSTTTTTALCDDTMTTKSDEDVDFTATMKTTTSTSGGTTTTTTRCYATVDYFCSNHNTKLEKRKVREKYWGGTTAGLRKWKYKLVDSWYCKCSNFKALPKPDPGK